jgi:hypothetical protein
MLEARIVLEETAKRFARVRRAAKGRIGGAERVEGIRDRRAHQIVELV